MNRLLGCKRLSTVSKTHRALLTASAVESRIATLESHILRLECRLQHYAERCEEIESYYANDTANRFNDLEGALAATNRRVDAWTKDV